jgi:hypothetical protein
MWAQGAGAAKAIDGAGKNFTLAFNRCTKEWALPGRFEVWLGRVFFQIDFWEIGALRYKFLVFLQSNLILFSCQLQCLEFGKWLNQTSRTWSSLTIPWAFSYALVQVTLVKSAT